MLSDEARARLSAMLTSPQADEPKSEDVTDGSTPPPDKGVDDQEGKATGTTDPPTQLEGDKDPDGSKAPADKSDKMVPVAELAKLRQERRKLKADVDELKLTVARLEGKAQSNQPPRTWVDDLDVDKPELDPLAKDVEDLKAFRAEQELAQGRILLNEVKADMANKDPTLDVDWAIGELALGKSPDEVLAKWSHFKARLVPTQQPTTTPTKTPPPTVARAKEGVAKPRTWDEISAQVRKTLRG